MKLCIIDQDESFLAFMRNLLSHRKDHGLYFTNTHEAIPVIKSESPDGLIWNTKQFQTHDIGTLEEIRRDNPAILIALSGEISDNPIANQLLNKGACEFLRKPVTPALMNSFFEQIEAPARFSHSGQSQSSILAKKYSFFELIGKTPEMLQLYERIEIVSHNHGNVLIQGEKGTGKDHVAKAIHQNSERRRGPFIKFSCSIIPKEVFDIELFGNTPESGGYSSIHKKSVFDAAAGGTLFLDEVECMPLETQVKLFEYFQERVAHPNASRQQNDGLPPPRIIVGTCQNLNELTQTGRFRYELFYRLNILPIDIPPLRHRQNDIPMIVEHFLNKYSPERPFEVFPEAMKLLVNHSWPGNIRQLETIIERLVLTVPGRVIFRHHLPQEIAQDHIGNLDLDTDRSLDEVVAEVECLMIKKALFAADGNMKLAARNLKVPYSSFRIKLRNLNLDR